MKSSFSQSDSCIKSSIDELFSLVTEYKSSSRFGALMRFCAQFKSFAPYNAMLIHLQRPGARYALTAGQWGHYNRVVKTDSRPIIILMPFSPVAYLFDIADTIVMEGRTDRVPKEASAPYDGDPLAPISKKTLAAIIENLPFYGIYYDTMVTGVDYSGKLQVAGIGDPPIVFPRKKITSLRLPDRWKCIYTIKTRTGASDTETFAAIVHELAHLICRHLRCMYNKEWEERSELSHTEEEFEAETVSWLVCQRLGVDNPSYRYLSGYLEKNGEIPHISIEEIFKATREIESMLSPMSAKQGFLYKYDTAFRNEIAKLNTKNQKSNDYSSEGNQENGNDNNE